MRVPHVDPSSQPPDPDQDEVSRFFENFEEHFFENPDFDIPGDLDANISGYMATISWDGEVKGEAVDFTCQRVVGRESSQWMTFKGDGIRQLQPAKPFDALRCADVLKKAIDGQHGGGHQKGARS